jgi:hypothetical protein
LATAGGGHGADKNQSDNDNTVFQAAVVGHTRAALLI